VTYMKLITLIFFLTLISLVLPGQNLVGSTGKEIMKYMKENEKVLHPEKVTNPTFKYLKYSDDSDSQTLFFFLDKDSVCRSIRHIIEIGSKPERVKQYNSLYQKKDENTWIDRKNGKDYRITIKDDSWSSTITIVPEK
jgi:hypothetical protein